MSEHNFGLILVAAGSAQRMKPLIEDKIVGQLNGRPVISYSLEAFLSTDVFNEIVIVVKDQKQKDHRDIPYENQPSTYLICTWIRVKIPGQKRDL